MSKTNPKTIPAWVTTVSIAIPIDPKDPQQAVDAKTAIETMLKSLPAGAVAEITRANYGRMDVAETPKPIAPAANDANGLEPKTSAQAIADKGKDAGEHSQITEEELLAALKQSAPTAKRDPDEIPDHMRRVPRQAAE